MIKNTPTQKIQEGRTLYNLKQQLILRKIENLKNEDARRAELHYKQIELINLQLQVEKQKNVV